MRVLGIDHGEARIGLALSDELGMLAHPLETIVAGEGENPETRIAEIARERHIETIVLGLPLRLDGTEGAAVEKVKAFAERLRSRIDPRIAIELVDERLSTVEAERALRDAGKDPRRSRKVIDQAAACIILQDYLDQQRGDGNPVEPDSGEGE